MATLLATTINVDSPSITMGGTTNAEGIRMTPASSTTYPVFLRSINPGGGEASPWIYKEQATDWGIWHNNPVNSIDFTKAGSGGIASNVGGSSTNTVTTRIDMANGYIQTIAGYRNSAGTTILDNSGNITGNAATASLATTSDRLTSRDNRTISPSSDDAFRLRFGFTSWTNNNSGSWADYLHLRSYSDATGGNDNLVMFRKDAIGMRIYQAGFGTSVAYSSFKDVAFTDQSFFIGTTSVALNRASASQTLTGVSIDGNAATATSATSLNSSNSIARVGSSGNYNTDFQNTPAGTVRHLGDDANATNNPGNSWWFVDNYRHSNGSNYWGTQVAWGWEDNANRLATRNVTGGSFGSWVYYLNSSNYTSYTIARGGDTVDGIVLYRSNKGSTSTVGANSNYSLQAFSSDAGAAGMSFHRGGYYAVNMGLDPDNVLRIGGWSASANRLQLDMSGNLTVAGNMYASIFYDSDNNSYYANPAATSNFNELTLAGVGTSAYGFLKYGGTRTGDWQSFTSTAGQINIVQVENIGGGSHTNYPTGVYSYGAVMSWRTDNHSFQLYAAHTGDLAYKTQWQNDNYSGWRRILDSTNYIHAANMNQYVRTTDSPTFVDLFTSGLQIRTASPTITLRDTDHRTGFIHVNSNIFYVLTGGVDVGSGNWGIVANSRWPLEINLSNNNATFGGIVDAISFTGAGTGLTGTAASLSIGGNAANVTGTVAIANGGTGATTAAQARTNLGIGTGSGTVTSVSGTGTVSGITLSGIVTTSGNLTLGGSLSGTASSLTAGAVTDGVYLSTTQTISGVKTFSSAPIATNIAKAWVHFNGTGTIAVNASHNVASLTDNGAGDYTVNFTTAMVDANYAVAGTVTIDYTSAQSLNQLVLAVPRQTNAQVAGSCRLACEYIHGAQLYDAVAVRAVFFR